MNNIKKLGKYKIKVSEDIKKLFLTIDKSPVAKVSPFIKQFSTILKVDNFQKILK